MLPLSSKVTLSAALTLLVLVFMALVWRGVAVTGGQWVYPLDDPYIHMSVAETLSTHGIWGVTPHGPSRCSSSMLWTLLLSGVFRLTGPVVWVPLALNILSGLAIVIIADRVLARAELEPVPRVVTLLGLVFLGPLGPVGLCGMEHLLHTAIVLLAVACAARLLTSPRLDVGALAWMAILSALLVMARYEALFMLSVIVLLLLWKKRIRAAAVVAVAGALPLLIAGAIWIRMGWGFLPNSVMLKGQMPDLHSAKGLSDLLGGNAFAEIARNPFMVTLIALNIATLLACWRRGGTPWSTASVWCWLFLGTTLLHAQFAKFGWFFRYETYLLVMGIVAVAIGWREASGDRWRQWWAQAQPSRRMLALLVLAYLFAPLAARGGIAHLRTTSAIHNIHDQQIQMARFIEAHYADEPIAANDIGALCYYTRNQCLDLWGLANRRVAQLRSKGRYDAHAMATLADDYGVKVVMVYPEWFEAFGGLPEQWVLVGQMKVSRSYWLGQNTVSFYATNAQQAIALSARMRQFAHRLPDQVKFHYAPFE